MRRATMLLADYGADVIQVEEPGSSDGTRAWGPPWVGDECLLLLGEPQQAQHHRRSQNRRGTRWFAVWPHADVVIENFKVGGAKAGAGLRHAGGAQPAAGLLLHHRLRADGTVIASAQLRLHPGAGGIMSITGPGGRRAVQGRRGDCRHHGRPLCDGGDLAALHVANSGRSHYIDVALLGTQVAWLVNRAQLHLATGEPPALRQRTSRSIVPYETFATADGRIAVGMGTDGQYRSSASRQAP